MLEKVVFKLIKEGIMDKNDLDFISQPLANKEEMLQLLYNTHSDV